MPVVLGARGAVPMQKIGSFNPAMLVHGEQAIELARPLPPDGTLKATGKIAAIYDKGKGAVVVSETESVDAQTGELLLPHALGRVHPRRGRLRRRARAVRAGQRAAARKPDHEVTYTTRARSGAALSPERRPQSAAQRPRVRQARRLPAADPARALHIRLHRPRAAPHAVRLGPGALQVDGGPLLEAGVPGRGADRSRCGSTARRACSRPGTSAARSCSTRAR